MEKISEAEREEIISQAKSVVNDEPIGWFDQLYGMANRDSAVIPWARMTPNPIMMDWVEKNCHNGKALIIGCGLGDDAIGLENIGFNVTAVDISQHCIDWCKERFPNSTVEWLVGDILNPIEEWYGNFDVIVEIHILQAIPDGGIRERAAEQMPKLLAKNGKMFCIGRLDDGRQTIQPPPWPLKQTWLKRSFAMLDCLEFTPFRNDDSPNIARYYAAWQNVG